MNSRHGPSVRDMGRTSVPLEGSFIQASSEEIQTIRRATCCSAGLRSWESGCDARLPVTKHEH